jgi:hypothetical protein
LKWQVQHLLAKAANLPAWLMGPQSAWIIEVERERQEGNNERYRIDGNEDVIRLTAKDILLVAPAGSETFQRLREAPLKVH